MTAPMPDTDKLTKCPTCGTPKYDDAKALIVYFKNDADRAEFSAVVQAAMPVTTQAIDTTSLPDTD